MKNFIEIFFGGLYPLFQVKIREEGGGIPTIYPNRGGGKPPEPLSNRLWGDYTTD
jgi:hypothetical protein